MGALEHSGTGGSFSDELRGARRAAPGKTTRTAAIQRKAAATTRPPTPAPAARPVQLKPHEDPFWFADAPVQRKLTIDKESDPEDVLDTAMQSAMLMAPVEVAKAWKTIVESKDLELIVRFDKVDEGDYGHTVVKGQTIWITVSDTLKPDDASDIEDMEDQLFQNINADTELQATLIHEFVLHVMPALPTLLEKKEWDSDEDEEHGSLAGWQAVLATGASVNPTVLRNTIVDALKHLHKMGKNIDDLVMSIATIAGKDVKLSWKLDEDNVIAEVLVGTNDGVIRLVDENDQLVEVDDEEEEEEEENVGNETTQQNKLEVEARPSRAVPQLAESGTGSGLPAQLRGGLEEMSGFDLSDLSVTRNSSEPASMNARAFARGNEIHLGPGNEDDLPHEAWHVVQQMQGRVDATTQHAGRGINDNPALEREADEMGARAAGGPSGQAMEMLTAAPSVTCAPAQLRGVNMDLVQKAIGGGFRQTASVQQTSDDMDFDGKIICHYSILESDPGKIHISFYPSDDKKYERKILHYGYEWKTGQEVFGPGSLILATWKPFKNDLGAMKNHADKLMEHLGKAIVKRLDEGNDEKESIKKETVKVEDKQETTSYEPLTFVSAGFMVPNSNGVGYQQDLKKDPYDY